MHFYYGFFYLKKYVKLNSLRQLDEMFTPEPSHPPTSPPPQPIIPTRRSTVCSSQCRLLKSNLIFPQGIFILFDRTYNIYGSAKSKVFCWVISGTLSYCNCGNGMKVMLRMQHKNPLRFQLKWWPLSLQYVTSYRQYLRLQKVQISLLPMDHDSSVLFSLSLYCAFWWKFFYNRDYFLWKQSAGVVFIFSSKTSILLWFGQKLAENQLKTTHVFD